MGIRNNAFLLIFVSYSYYEVYNNTQRAFSGLGFTYVSDELKADREFILEDVKSWAFGLQYASDELKADPELIKISKQ